MTELGMRIDRKVSPHRWPSADSRGWQEKSEREGAWRANDPACLLPFDGNARSSNHLYY